MTTVVNPQARSQRQATLGRAWLAPAQPRTRRRMRMQAAPRAQLHPAVQKASKTQAYGCGERCAERVVRGSKAFCQPPVTPPPWWPWLAQLPLAMRLQAAAAAGTLLVAGQLAVNPAAGEGSELRGGRPICSHGSRSPLHRCQAAMPSPFCSMHTGDHGRS